MKMQKRFCFLLFYLLSVVAFAQKNEVKVMYSPVSLLRVDNWGRDIVDSLTGQESDNIINEKDTKINLFFHAEVINFTWGKNYGLTGQVGFGHKGLVSLGGFVKW